MKGRQTSARSLGGFPPCLVTGLDDKSKDGGYKVKEPPEAQAPQHDHKNGRVPPKNSWQGAPECTLSPQAAQHMAVFMLIMPPQQKGA